MEHSDEQKTEFKREFGIRRKRQLLLAIPLLAIGAALVILDEKGVGRALGLAPNIVGPVFFALVLGAIVFSLWNWRCPACNVYLGKGINPSFCANCGAPLQ